MARLTAAERKKLPKKDFAVPSKAKGKSKGEPGNYPIEDRKHAIAALRLAGKNPSEAASIRAKVYKKYPDLKPKGSKKK